MGMEDDMNTLALNTFTVRRHGGEYDQKWKLPSPPTTSTAFAQSEHQKINTHTHGGVVSDAKERAGHAKGEKSAACPEGLVKHISGSLEARTSQSFF